jgi:hypothetical protein
MDHVKDDDKEPRVRTHEQVSVSERRRMPRGLDERSNRYRPAYVAKRSWTNRKDERYSKFKFRAPEWLMPRNGVHAFHTWSASIVWGICGKMADVPEYE